MKNIAKYSTHIKTDTQVVEIDSWEKWFSHIHNNYSSAVYCIDKNLKDYLNIDIENVIFLEGGDEIKNLSIVEAIASQFHLRKVDKNSIIVAIGGGSISDLIGFIASTYLRGVAYACIPSTLLSIVDASVGGKNGVNFQATKNQIGTIYQPCLLGIDYHMITSMGEDNVSEGFAEIIKYALTLDEEQYSLLNQNNLSSFISNPELHKEVIKRCIHHKMNIVEKDPFDNKERKILNYGHTFGHAIEATHHLSHGKSVALGLILATKFSREYYQFDIPNLKEVLSKYNLPVEFKFDMNTVILKLQNDKKKKGNEIDYPFLTQVGKHEIKPIELRKLEEFLLSNQDSLWD